MGRPILSKGYAELINKIREKIPEIAITTDVIVGFPGESQEAFEITRNFIQGLGFAGGHVFTYSPRPGTAAFKMKDQVPHQIARQRNAVMREDFIKSGEVYCQDFIGQVVDVLWESSIVHPNGTIMMSGLTDTYLRVSAIAREDLWNEITKVALISSDPQQKGLLGIIINDG